MLFTGYITVRFNSNGELFSIYPQTEKVSCSTNGRKIQGFPEIGRGLSEIPNRGPLLQNIQFCAWNILQNIIMKQQRWLDLVVIRHD